MRIIIPDPSLVVLIGVSGSGKSTFARKHFKATEILSSDHFRAMICDDEAEQSATRDAFELLHFVAAKRLRAGRLTVVDATNVRREARKPLVELAVKYQCILVAIVFNLPLPLCQERNRQRCDRTVEDEVSLHQYRHLQNSLDTLAAEGFGRVYILSTQEGADGVTLERQPVPP